MLQARVLELDNTCLETSIKGQCKWIPEYRRVSAAGGFDLLTGTSSLTITPFTLSIYSETGTVFFMKSLL